MIYAVTAAVQAHFIGDECVAVRFAVERLLRIHDLSVRNPHVALLNLPFNPHAHSPPSRCGILLRW